MTTRRTRGSGGFTLIELLATIVIAGVIMGGLLAFFTFSLQQSASIEDRATETKAFATLNTTLQRDIANASFIGTSNDPTNYRCPIPSDAYPHSTTTGFTTGAYPQYGPEVIVLTLKSKPTEEDPQDTSRTQYVSVAVKKSATSPLTWNLYRRQCPNFPLPTAAETTVLKMVSKARYVGTAAYPTAANSTVFTFSCNPDDGATQALATCRSNANTGALTTNRNVEVRLAFNGASKKRVVIAADSQAPSTIQSYFRLECNRVSTSLSSYDPSGCATTTTPSGTARITTIKALDTAVSGCTSGATATELVKCLGPVGVGADSLKYKPTLPWKSFTWVHRGPRSLADFQNGTVTEVRYHCLIVAGACSGATGDLNPGDPDNTPGSPGMLDNPVDPMTPLQLWNTFPGDHEVTLVAVDSASTSYTSTTDRVISGSMSWNVKTQAPTVGVLTAVDPDNPTVAKTGGATPPCAPTCEGVKIRFIANGIADPDGTIVSGVFDWGNGTTSPAPLTCAAGTCSSTIDHGFFAASPPGGYLVKLTVTDNEGGTASTNTIPITITGNLAPTLVVSPDVTNTNIGPPAVTFTAVFGDPDGTINAGAWTFTDGVTTPLAAPGPCTPTCTSTITRTFATDGVYTLTVTVTDNQGATVGDTVTINVGDRAPVADITVGNMGPSGPAPFTVTFDDVLSYDPDTPGVCCDVAEWDFGDPVNSTAGNPNTSSLEAPTHTYSAVGTYTVTLRVQNDGLWSAPVTTQVTVSNANPVAVAAGTPLKGRRSTVANPSSVSFVSTGSYDPNAGQTLSYAWNFGDAANSTAGNLNTATTASASHRYTVVGSYDALLTVSDGYGGSDSAPVGPIYIGQDDDVDGWYVDSLGGQFTQAGDCNDTWPGGVNIYPGAPDPINGVDENCDGVDGVITDTIFVRGKSSTGNPIGVDTGTCGLPTAPCRQISHALQRASQTNAKYIVATGGAYTRFSVIGRGIEITGGAPGNFVGAATLPPTPPTASASAVCSASATYTCIDGSTSGGLSTGIFVDGATAARPVLIRNVEVLAQRFTGGVTTGQTSYGVFVAYSPIGSLTFQNVNVRAGLGAKGTQGTDGLSVPASAGPGPIGADGLPTVRVGGFFSAETRRPGGGGGSYAILGSTGGNGGAGGAAATSNFLTSATAGLGGGAGFSPGGDVQTNSGSQGAGGSGGAPERCVFTVLGVELPDPICALGGNDRGDNGTNGAAGAPGADGVGGGKGVAGTGIGTYDGWLPVDQMIGREGGRGTHGAPGGGGGGGGGSNAGEPDSLGASGGGGGGGGRRADAGGAGGGAGGAAIGMYVFQSNPTLSNVYVTLGVAGAGGNGGAGGVGQAGGPGGLGGGDGGGYGGFGGNGGAGGKGGNSGGGGGGAGGPSYGIVRAGSTPVLGGVTYNATPGVVGAGGTGGGVGASKGVNGDPAPAKANQVGL